MKFLKEKHKNIICLLLLFILYIITVKKIRPYIYFNFNYKLLDIFVGVLPNFFGSIMLYVFLETFFNFPKKRNLIFGFGLIIFMELRSLYFSNIPFDIYDIVASILALMFCGFLTKKNN